MIYSVAKPGKDDGWDTRQKPDKARGIRRETAKRWFWVYLIAISFASIQLWRNLGPFHVQLQSTTGYSSAEREKLFL